MQWSASERAHKSRRVPKHSNNTKKPTETTRSFVSRLEVKLKTDISKFKQLVEVLESPHDTAALREQIAHLKKDIQKTSNRIMSRLSESNGQTLNSENQASLKKSVQNYKMDLEKYQALLELCTEKEHSSPPTNSSSTYDLENTASVSSELEPLLEYEQQRDSIENNTEHVAIIVEETDHELESLTKHINELDKMVREQAPVTVDSEIQVDVDQGLQDRPPEIDVVVRVDENEKTDHQDPNQVEKHNASEFMCRRIKGVLKSCSIIVCGAILCGSVVTAFVLIRQHTRTVFIDSTVYFSKELERVVCKDSTLGTTYLSNALDREVFIRLLKEGVKFHEMRRSPYTESNNAITADMQSSKFCDKDPVKLINQLQDYVLRLQSAAELWKDKEKQKQTLRSYDVQSTDCSDKFDYQKTRDLPPKIRSVVEDNRMLRTFIKELKTRCHRAESELQKERRNALQTRTQLEKLRRMFTSKDVEEVKQSEELKLIIQELRQTIERKDSAITVLGRKESTTLKLHAADIANEEKQRRELQQEIEELKAKIDEITQTRRQEAIQTKQLRQKHETLRKKANEWKLQVEMHSEQQKHSSENDKESTNQGRERPNKTCDKNIWTEPLEDESVVLMLCVVESPIRNSGSLMERPKESLKTNKVVVSLSQSKDDDEPILICAKVKTKEPMSNSRPSMVPNVFGVTDESQEALEIIRDVAAVKIQSSIRGMLARKHVEQNRLQLKQQHGSKTVLSCIETEHSSSRHRSQSERNKQLQQKASKSKPVPKTRSERR